MADIPADIPAGHPDDTPVRLPTQRQARTPAQAQAHWDRENGELRIRTATPGPGPRIGYTGTVWITLDATDTPLALDLHQVPDEVARLVPVRPRTDGGGGLPWLLDTDSNWVWLPLPDGGPRAERLECEGTVDIQLDADRKAAVSVTVTVTP